MKNFDMENKIRQVCDAFRIEGIFQDYEEMTVGNVNRTHKVNFIHVDGEAKVLRCS